MKFQKLKKSKKAFTLAEVLITLGIIGVVAAITMPTLIANYQKQETVNKLKKTYSLLAQAIKLSEVENGNISEWNLNLTGTDFYNKYMNKFIKSVKIMDNTEYISKVSVKYLNGNAATGQGWTRTTDTAPIYVVLPDDTMLIIEGFTNNRNLQNIVIDVNGMKKPNKIGKDIFLFALKNQTPFFYPQYHTMSRDDLLNGTFSEACNTSHCGHSCASVIMQDSWQIKDDYPW